MKRQLINPQIAKTTKKQWKLHQQIGQFIVELDRLPDAAQVRADTPRTAPLSLLPMVF